MNLNKIKTALKITGLILIFSGLAAYIPYIIFPLGVALILIGLFSYKYKGIRNNKVVVFIDSHLFGFQNTGDAINSNTSNNNKNGIASNNKITKSTEDTDSKSSNKTFHKQPPKGGEL